MDIWLSITSYFLFVVFSIAAWTNLGAGESYSENELQLRRYALLATAMACAALGKACANRVRIEALEKRANGPL